MNSTHRPRAPRSLALLLLLSALAAAHPAAADHVVDLVAMPYTRTMSDGTEVHLWGFALDGPTPVPSIPGPAIVVPPGETTLEVNLRNDLAVPVSLVIPGQTPDGGFAPERFTDGLGRPRVRSFTAETSPGATGVYRFVGVRPGTYLYHSGTHAAVQVQMGLYGAMTRDHAAGEAYPGVTYDQEVLAVYHEIDPVLHEAVATGRYGPGQPIRSTLAYKPSFTLVNGAEYAPDLTVLPAVAGQTTLLRLVNASLRTHVPVVLNATLDLIAEDGNPYPYARPQVSVLLPAGKTTDALLRAPAAGSYPLFDRALPGRGRSFHCGDKLQMGTEQCDGPDSGGCPSGLCRPDCTCAPPTTTSTSSSTTTSTSVTTTSVTTTTFPPVTNLIAPVGTGSDDAEQQATGSVNITSSDLELVQEDTIQTVGIRFRNLAIPPGATILSAFIQFTVDETGSVATNLKIEGQAIDNAPTFTTTPNGIGTRARTTAFVNWTPAPWPTVNQALLAQRTPDLTSVVQEVVGRPGWASGNALAVIITGTGKRVARSYESSASQAARLNVSFHTGFPTTTTTSSTSTSTSVTSTTSTSATSTTSTSVTSSTSTSTSSTTSTSLAPANVLERRVAASGDDAEQRVSNGAVSLSSSDLELVTDSGNVQLVGMRFTNVTIPQGATIVRAWIQFTSDSTTSAEATSLALAGHAADNATIFTTATANVSSRPLTSASVAWPSIPAWNAGGLAGLDQRTPDLAAVIQEIVNRPGWTSGNALAVVVSGSGRRVAVSRNASATQAPLLHVEY